MCNDRLCEKKQVSLAELALGFLLLFWVVAPSLFEGAQRDLFTLKLSEHAILSAIYNYLSFFQKLLGGIAPLGVLLYMLLVYRHSARMTVAKIVAVFHGLFLAVSGTILLLLQVAPTTILNAFAPRYATQEAAEFLRSSTALNGLFGTVDWVRLGLSLVFVVGLLAFLYFTKPEKEPLGKPLGGVILWCGLWSVCVNLFNVFLLSPIKIGTLSKNDYGNLSVAQTAYDYLFDLAWLIPVLLPGLVFLFRHYDGKKVYLYGLLVMAGLFLLDVFVGEYSLAFLQSPSFGAEDQWGAVALYLVVRAAYAFIYYSLLFIWLMATIRERVPFWMMSAFIVVGGVIHLAVSIFWYSGMRGPATPAALMVPNGISLVLLAAISVVTLLVCHKRRG